MTTFQSEHGKRRVHTSTPEQAGQVNCDVSEFTFAAAFTAATDRVELGVLPAGARLVDAHAVAESLNGNISIGLMSGDVGDPSDARTVGSEVLAAQAMTSGLHRITTPAALQIPTNKDKDRSIGLTASADIAGGVAKKIRLFLFYTL